MLNVSGKGNVAIGVAALAVSGNGLTVTGQGYTQNTAIGRGTLVQCSSGTHNTALGSFAGSSVTTGSYNIYIGENVDGDATASNQLNIGGLIKGDTSTGFVNVATAKPHIIPDVLYPAVAGKLSDGSTSHSGAYGTAQSDTRSYYYTDIKGSKPIKDPRIGAHFGSQRHKTKSLQLLEQETATHGKNVYSIDGRDWLRGVDSWGVQNNARGNHLRFGETESITGVFMEVTGYFNKLNLLAYNEGNRAGLDYHVDGGSATQTNDTQFTAIGSPLDGRYVDPTAVHTINIGTITTPGIHTVKFVKNNTTAVGQAQITGIELIAQDTTSTATKSQIQIPSQNVVSYGKKFTVSGTPHFNPFGTKGGGSGSTIPNNTVGDLVADGWTGSTDAYWDSSLDTATSLGLGAWETATDFYRPVNGGRIVKWVDSTGAIKTSVNMMPPEAHSINVQDAGLNPATGTHNWSTKYLPSFGNSLVGSDLAVNGDFSSTTGWTLEVAQYTFSGNTCIAASVPNHQMVYRQIQTVVKPGRKYKLLWTASAVTAGTFDAVVWGGGFSTSVYGNELTSAGASSLIFEGGDGVTIQYIAIRAQGTSSGVFTSVTLHEISDAEAQAEVAKTFHWREFGNGSANGNATYADASMINTIDDIAYVMDDGLTSLSGEDVIVNAPPIAYADAVSKGWYFTFIGTGLHL